MPRALEQWTVLPHGQLSQIDENILTVAGDLHMPLGDFPRRMSVVRLRDRSLVIYSAIALHEDEMRALEAFGRPAYLVVPSDKHRLDAKIWQDRYPELIVIAPEGARDKVNEVVRVDATSVDFCDPRVQFATVRGTNGHECALVVETSSGTTLIVNDLIGNVRPGHGVVGWLSRVTGVTGGEPMIPSYAKHMIVKDRRAVAQQLEEWAGLDTLRRIIVSHGMPIDERPRATLHRLATSL